MNEKTLRALVRAVAAERKALSRAEKVGASRSRQRQLRAFLRQLQLTTALLQIKVTYEAEVAEALKPYFREMLRLQIQQLTSAR